MRTILATVALLPAVISAGPAAATGSIHCRAVDGSGTSVELGIGTLPVLAVISARIEAAGQVWSLDSAAGLPMIVGQASRSEGRKVVDFTDTNLVAIIAELRLLRVQDGPGSAEVGTLRIPGLAVHPLVCDGP